MASNLPGGPPVTAERLSFAFGGLADKTVALTDTFARSVGSVSGFTSSVSSLSAKVTGLGALIATIIPGGKAPGIGIAAAGALGILAGGVAGAASGLAASASPNGLQSVDKAFELLSGTIGSMVLPGFVALGGAAMMGATRVQVWIDKNLDNIIDGWATAIKSAWESVQKFGDWFDKWVLGKTDKEGKTREDTVGENLGMAGAIGALWDAEEKGDALHQKIQAGNKRREALWDEQAGQFINNRPIMDAGRLAAQNKDLQKLGLEGRGQAVWGMQPQAKVDDNGKVQGLNAAGKPDTSDIDKHLATANLMREQATNMRVITKDMAASWSKPGITDPVSKWKEVAMQLARSEMDQKLLDMQKRGLDASNRLADAMERMANIELKKAAQGVAKAGWVI